MRISKNKPELIIICGPTGIGKTALTMEIYKHYPSIIISADSIQTYRFMNIGSAKPSEKELKKTPHELIDICNPDENFDAGKFTDRASAIIEKAYAANKISIITGGTGLYIKSLTKGLFRSRPADKDILEALCKEEKTKGPGHLYSRLKKTDPQTAVKIHPNDTFRLARALECFISTGEKISSMRANQQNIEKFNYLKLGLIMDRKNLYERIEKRVDIMIEEGLLEEVEKLRSMGYGRELKAMNSIGYKHMNIYIDGEVSWEEAIRLLKRDTRRYAKRQLTWFNADPEIHWIHPEDTKKARELIDNFLAG